MPVSFRAKAVPAFPCVARKWCEPPAGNADRLICPTASGPENRDDGRALIGATWRKQHAALMPTACGALRRDVFANRCCLGLLPYSKAWPQELPRNRANRVSGADVKKNATRSSQSPADLRHSPRLAAICMTEPAEADRDTLRLVLNAGTRAECRAASAGADSSDACRLANWSAGPEDPRICRHGRIAAAIALASR